MYVFQNSGLAQLSPSLLFLLSTIIGGPLMQINGGNGYLLGVINGISQTFDCNKGTHNSAVFFSDWIKKAMKRVEMEKCGTSYWADNLHKPWVARMEDGCVKGELYSGGHINCITLVSFWKVLLY